MNKIEKKDLQQFLDIINQRFGIYLDCINGFLLNVKQIEEWQKLAARRTNKPIEELDQAALIRSNHPPVADLEQCKKLEKHRIPQGVYKANNSRGGLNHSIALSDCLCAFFNEWETFKRDVLKKKGMRDDQIIPVLGYLKKIRDRLTHKDQKSAQHRIEEFKLTTTDYILPGFDTSTNIELFEQDLDNIVLELKNCILNM